MARKSPPKLTAKALDLIIKKQNLQTRQTHALQLFNMRYSSQRNLLPRQQTAVKKQLMHSTTLMAKKLVKQVTLKQLVKTKSERPN